MKESTLNILTLLTILLLVVGLIVYTSRGVYYEYPRPNITNISQYLVSVR